MHAHAVTRHERCSTDLARLESGRILPVTCQLGQTSQLQPQEIFTGPLDLKRGRRLTSKILLSFLSKLWLWCLFLSFIYFSFSKVVENLNEAFGEWSLEWGLDAG